MRLLESRADGPVLAKVKATRLNIRVAPNGQSERVAGHLMQGTQTEVLEEKAGWCRVKVELEGWVAKRYLERS